MAIIIAPGENGAAKAAAQVRVSEQGFLFLGFSNSAFRVVLCKSSCRREDQGEKKCCGTHKVYFSGVFLM